MADKCLVKLSQSLLQLVILSVYKRRTNYYTIYDSVTVNISVFIEPRNFSFQNDISPKNHEIGTLVVRKL